jgi:hypothetical protein
LVPRRDIPDADRRRTSRRRTLVPRRDIPDADRRRTSRRRIFGPAPGHPRCGPPTHIAPTDFGRTPGFRRRAPVPNAPPRVNPPLRAERAPHAGCAPGAAQTSASRRRIFDACRIVSDDRPPLS